MTDKEKLGHLNINGSLYQTRISKKFENRKQYQPANPGMILSFIPGTIIEILIKEGQTVKKGEELLILEAMKMQNRLKSPVDGKVVRIAVENGTRVPKGALLLEIE